MSEDNDVDFGETLSLTTDIISAFVSNNKTDAAEIPALIQEVHDTLRALAAGSTANAGNQEPAVPIAKSVTPDYIICLEDGKQLKMLKRYLRTQYDLSPEDYRRKWGLPAEYPLVAPKYAKKRSQYAKAIGLGRGVGAKKKATPTKQAPGKRGRPRKAR
ncbi:MAG: MucR family transcriptional regulator [Pseudomonadota bacterium]